MLVFECIGEQAELPIPFLDEPGILKIVEQGNACARNCLDPAVADLSPIHPVVIAVDRLCGAAFGEFSLLARGIDFLKEEVRLAVFGMGGLYRRRDKMESSGGWRPAQ